MTRSDPTVVPDHAAEAAREFVFRNRASAAIDPCAVATRLLKDGYGSKIPTDLRVKRVKKWVLQVHRRLLKFGWLGEPDREGWPPTAALRKCTDPEVLARRVPRRPSPAIREPAPPPPENWPGFVQDWVFRHRQARFQVGEVAAAMVQRGYGVGHIGARLEGARALADGVLGELELEGLLEHGARSETWTPTELLQSWPAADEG